MKRICAWCETEMMDVESAVNPADAITHGLCRSCAEKISVRKSESVMEFLDRLDVPILLAGPEPKILTANKPAQKLLGKGLAEIEGRRGGEVIECLYAKTPEGCGGDSHCKSCTIRNTVMETFRTGESFLDVKAFPDIQVGNKSKTMSMKISTEKVANVVLLRIDEFD